MSWLKSVILGFVRGLTEFLPISGTGHQALLQQILGLQEYQSSGMLLEAAVTFGLLTALVVFERRELRVMGLELLRSLNLIRRPRRTGPDRLSGRMMVLLVVSALPCVLVLPVLGWVRSLYSNLLFTAVCLVLGGLVVYITDHLPHGDKDGKTMGLSDAAWIGAAQVLSVLPGMPRTGLMVSTAWVLGLDPAFGLQFSLLAWVPVLFVRFFILLVQGISAGGFASVPVYLIGWAVTALAGFVSLNLVRSAIRQKKLGEFGFYCWGIAIVAFVLFLIC